MPATNLGGQYHHHHTSSHYNHAAGAAHPTAAALLTLDEKTLAQRKLNVQKFGAGWLRPPGVLKTYQASLDEQVEREEQEALARREEALMEAVRGMEEGGGGGGRGGVRGDHGRGG